MKYYKIGIIIFTVFWLSSIDVAGQDKISYSEDIEEAISGFKTDQKLILAIYTEDEELQEEYFAYIDWHDSLVDLLNKEYTVYTEKSEYNALELIYSREGVLSFMELNEGPEDMYAFLSNISENKKRIIDFINVEERRVRSGKFGDVPELYAYLSCAKDVLKVAKEEELNEFVSNIPETQLLDSQYMELVLYHSQTMGPAYRYLKLIANLNVVQDSLIKERTKETFKRIITTTFNDIWEYDAQELFIILYEEFGWFLKKFESQEWNNKYSYALAKYNVALQSKGDKDELFKSTELFVNNWIINQIKSNIPFMTAEELSYDLAAIVDLLLDRKVDKAYLPAMLPWIEEAVRIYPGHLILEVYAKLLKKLDKKNESKISNNKAKQFKSQISKKLVKENENQLNEALDNETILIYILEKYLYSEEGEYRVY